MAFLLEGSLVRLLDSDGKRLGILPLEAGLETVAFHLGRDANLGNSIFQFPDDIEGLEVGWGKGLDIQAANAGHRPTGGGVAAAYADNRCLGYHRAGIEVPAVLLLVPVGPVL